MVAARAGVELHIESTRTEAPRLGDVDVDRLAIAFAQHAALAGEALHAMHQNRELHLSRRPILHRFAPSSAHTCPVAHGFDRPVDARFFAGFHRDKLPD
jgi:hypothetical protein